jgi:phosphoenolpyruvate carboxylase
MLFGECLAALIAAVALEAVSVLPEALALNIAVVAGHGTFPLESHSLSPDNEFAGLSRLRLWWILTPVHR